MIQQSYFKGHFRPKPNLQLEVPVELNYWTQQMPYWEKLQEINHRFHHCKPRSMAEFWDPPLKETLTCLLWPCLSWEDALKGAQPTLAGCIFVASELLLVVYVGLFCAGMSFLRWLSICLQQVAPHGPRWFRLIHSTLDISTINPTPIVAKQLKPIKRRPKKNRSVFWRHVKSCVPSGKLTVCYWTWPFIVSFP